MAEGIHSARLIRIAQRCMLYIVTTCNKKVDISGIQ
jgi:hypothetical protein